MSPAQRAAWNRLSPNKRRILLSHLPDDMERDANLRHSVATAMVNVFGPWEYGPEVAIQEEASGTRDTGPEYAMTLVEIGEEIGLIRTRVLQILENALRKLRNPNLGMAEFMYGDRATDQRKAA